MLPRKARKVYTPAPVFDHLQYMQSKTGWWLRPGNEAVSVTKLAHSRRAQYTYQGARLEQVIVQIEWIVCTWSVPYVTDFEVLPEVREVLGDGEKAIWSQ